ncbi:threonine aldolase [Zalerion maritima]|uniref:Threonine aldolase n=1 Tax=Zalerion maritima TaxID=339359 RepID=A0AAD5RQ70_9PEZI|nr:threonine aldolase [Zalerion maritima]
MNRPKVSSSWIGAAGNAALDLRSDTQTTPTPSMLAAIQSCSLLDDVFEEDTTTADLEAHVASLTGQEAGLFVLSGTMGNQLGLRTLLKQPPHSVLCDHRSHIIQYEAGGVASLSQALVRYITPSNGVYLTLDDISDAILPWENSDIHCSPIRVISLENTLNGMIMPLSEVKMISEFARERGILLHLDGARLWEAVVAGAGSLADYCQYFDTISLCFSKGLGAPVGSILLGTKERMGHARWVRKSIGGGLRQAGVVSAPARVAVDETFGKGPNGEGGLLRKSHENAKRLEKLWVDLGGKMQYPVHTNMCWLDLNSSGVSLERFIKMGSEVGLRIADSRLVINYQVSEEAIERLQGVFEKVLAEKDDVSQEEKINRYAASKDE